jgi:predicted dehydrogenase
VTHFAPGTHIHLYGSDGVLKYELAPHDRLLGGRRGERDLHEISIPADKELTWRVEADFIDAIRMGTKVEFTNFAAGVRYMDFTEAVARSAATGSPVELPLAPPD